MCVCVCVCVCVCDALEMVWSTLWYVTAESLCVCVCMRVCVCVCLCVCERCSRDGMEHTLVYHC